MPPKKIKKVCLRKITSLGYSVENSDYLSTEHWPDKEGVRNSEWKAVQIQDPTQTCITDAL